MGRVNDNAAHSGAFPRARCIPLRDVQYGMRRDLVDGNWDGKSSPLNLERPEILKNQMRLEIQCSRDIISKII